MRAWLLFLALGGLTYGLSVAATPQRGQQGSQGTRRPAEIELVDDTPEVSDGLIYQAPPEVSYREPLNPPRDDSETDSPRGLPARGGDDDDEAGGSSDGGGNDGNGGNGDDDDFIVGGRNPFTQLSKLHTIFGVSQYLATNVGDGNVPLKLTNPQRFTMVALIFLYERPRDEEDAGSTPGLYREVMVLELPPHGSTGIDDANFFGRSYAEIISVPLEALDDDGDDDILTAFAKSGDDDDDDDEDEDDEDEDDEDEEEDDDDEGDDDDDDDRLADGLGIYAESLFGHQTFLLNPALFSLPSNTVVAGQREQACMDAVDALINAGLPADLFEDFGIRCFN